MKTRAGKKEGYYRIPDYRIGNWPHTVKFKVVRIFFVLYHSNLQDEITGHDGVRKWMFCKFEEDLQESIDNEDSKQKYLWGIVKQIQHG